MVEELSDWISMQDMDLISGQLGNQVGRPSVCWDVSFSLPNLVMVTAVTKRVQLPRVLAKDSSVRRKTKTG